MSEPRTDRYVVLVDFRLLARRHEDFRRIVDDIAGQSVAREPGCCRFAGIEVEGESDRVLLYEIYDSKAAFRLHLASEHFGQFDAAAAPLCLHKQVIEGVLVFEAGERAEYV